jgi:hypothetical protein
MMPETLVTSSGTNSSSSTPRNPYFAPWTSTPSALANIVEARTAAFIPGASPPLVTMASLFNSTGVPAVPLA